MTERDIEILRREISLAQVFLDRALQALAAAEEAMKQKKAEEPIFHEP